MPVAIEPRFRKRVPCEVTLEGNSHPGIVLNLSRSGLYIQTAVSARRGDPVALDLNANPELPAIPVTATVMWNRQVGARWRGVKHGGVGVHIRSANEAYYNLLAEVSKTGAAPSRSDDSEGADRRREDYRVRVKLAGAPRSRTLFLTCRDEDEARARATELVGREWEILEILRDEQ